MNFETLSVHVIRQVDNHSMHPRLWQAPSDAFMTSGSTRTGYRFSLFTVNMPGEPVRQLTHLPSPPPKPPCP